MSTGTPDGHRVPGRWLPCPSSPFLSCRYQRLQSSALVSASPGGEPTGGSACFGASVTPAVSPAATTVASAWMVSTGSAASVRPASRVPTAASVRGQGHRAGGAVGPQPWGLLPAGPRRLEPGSVTSTHPGGWCSHGQVQPDSEPQLSLPVPCWQHPSSWGCPTRAGVLVPVAQTGRGAAASCWRGLPAVLSRLLAAR